ncbi:MAG: hypothetical protein IT561_16885, partial [Alphaproteobacteria bacterium]|nr:hypothetical protein [Alphaproteobacteria bacterium]
MARGFPWRTVLLLIALVVARPAAALPDGELAAIAQGFEQRRRALLEAQRRDPFPKPQCRAAPAPDDPCLLGKLNQALAIFHLGGDATAGNALVEETLAGIARLPGYLRDFHFMKATLFFRLVRQFGVHGTVGPGTMRSELERAVVDLFAQWAHPACRIADADPRA